MLAAVPVEELASDRADGVEIAREMPMSAAFSLKTSSILSAATAISSNGCIQTA